MADDGADADGDHGGQDPAAWDPGPDPPGTGAPAPVSRPASAAPVESRRATVALILGAAGFVTIPILVSTAAIVVANQALREIAADPGLAGEQRARVGRALGWIELAIIAITIVVAVIVGATD